MKKILSILMILVLVGGVAFAQVEPTFTGEATLSWGIDLGKGTDKDGSAKLSHGFLNEASASVSLPFVKSGASKGEGDVYAYIDLSGVNLGLSADMKGAKATGKVGAVNAKIVFYGAYITLYNAPNMTTDYATRIVNGDNYDPFKTGFKGYGTKIGYANKDKMDIDVGLKFVSNGSWKDRDGFTKSYYKKTITGTWMQSYGKYYYSGIDFDNEILKKTDGVTDITTGLYEDSGEALLDEYQVQVWTKDVDKKDMNGQYGFGIDFHMAPVEKYLTVDANFNMTFGKREKYQKTNTDWADKPAMNFGVNLKSSPVEGLTLALGFDGGSAYAYTDKDGKISGIFAWALGFGADYKVEKVGTFDLGVYVASKATPYGKDTVVDADKGIKDGTDMAMTFGYSGLPIVEGLDIHARVNVFRLLSQISDAAKKGGKTIPVGLNVGVAYTSKISDSMSIKPYADVWGETNVKKYADGTALADQTAYFGLAYKLGVAFMPMERLTIDASWMHGKLGTDDNLGTGKKVTPVQHKANNGKFILSAKITF